MASRLELLTECGAFLRKSSFGQLQHHCHRPITHKAVVGSGQTQGFGCETHAKRLASRFHGGVTRPIQGVPTREINGAGQIVYHDREVAASIGEPS